MTARVFVAYHALYTNFLPSSRDTHLTESFAILKDWKTQ